MTVVVEDDTCAGLKATGHPFVKVSEQFGFFIGDEEKFEIPDATEIVEQVLGFELVNFVENHDVWRAIVLSEAIQQHVSRGGLAVDVQRFADTLEKSVQCLESGVVLPAHTAC